jgi:hypothetical protein
MLDFFLVDREKDAKGKKRNKRMLDIIVWSNKLVWDQIKRMKNVRFVLTKQIKECGIK